MDYLQQIWGVIAGLENNQDWQEALTALNELDREIRLVQRELGADEIVLVPMARQDAYALKEATVEYGFSTEPGGINQGDKQAEENLRVLDGLRGRVDAQIKAASPGS